MTDLDLVPPSLPGAREQKHKGFFHKFFFKEDSQESAPAQEHETHEDVDLEEIKRKLQLDETSAPAPHEELQHHDPLDDLAQPPHEDVEFTPQVEEPATPPPEMNVEIGDWTEEATPAPVAPEGESEMSQETSSVPTPEELSDWDKEMDQEFDHVKEELAQSEPGAHHDEVEMQFSKLDTKQEKIEQKIEDVPQLPVSDWHLQEKEVPQDKYFILRNGLPIKSLRELTEAMEYIDDDTFNHHMNEHRNDFANWIQGVIGNGDLAEQIRHAQTRDDVASVLGAHRENAQERLHKSVNEHEQALKKAEKIASDVEQLRAQLEKKTQELSEEKLLAKKRIKEALDQEVAARMQHEREELAGERAEVTRLHDEAERMLKQHEQSGSELNKREARIADREEKVAMREDELKMQKEEASQMLKDAARVKSDLEKIAAYQKQVQSQLKEIEKKQQEIARAEASLKEREAKVTADLTRIHEEQQRLAGMQAVHDEREAKVKTLEQTAAEKHAEAERRAKEALAAERASTTKIKTETKKLNDVRKQIDSSLKKVIKNKNQAMHAKQIREHLEKTILDTKQGVVDERKQLESEGFASMIENRASATPIGQPGSDLESDILSTKDADVYKKVEMAREALDKGDLNSAKQFYNELREDFGKQQLSAPEKNALYMSIRELYDDIHLAMLEQ